MPHFHWSIYRSCLSLVSVRCRLRRLSVCGYQDLRGEVARQVAMQPVFELYSALCIEVPWSGEMPGYYVKAVVTGPGLEMLVGWGLAAFQRRREQGGQ
jgi:hypothetical protein